ncbi:anaphase-promoting complex subunit 1 [Euwallacea similis]|uniref:anaphase-promoting complex subunit 1 n=1 Tax=Euwallacea similis TaxID=1736056 RepID=UPI00344E921F
MIAASDPLEFVPRGRQQIARHPGPPEPIFKHKDSEDCLETGLEKFSLSEDASVEFWVIRKTPQDEFSSEKDPKCASKLNNSLNKSRRSASMCKDHITHTSELDLLDESASFKTPDGSLHQRVFGKRTSDVSARYSNKNFIGSASDRKNEDNKTQGECQTNMSYLNFQIDPGFMEDELYVKGQTAVWSRGLLNNIDQQENGRKVISCYTVPLPIKQATWSTFYCERADFDATLSDLYARTNEPSGSPSSAICLVDSHHVRIFVVKGEQYVIPMPFPIEKIWNTRFGIFVEKTLEVLPINNNKFLEDNPGTIFSLTHPLDDVCPVAISRNLSITRLMVNNYKLVYTSENPSICMVYDVNTKEHSVYKIRKVRPEEKDYGDVRSGFHSATQNSQKLKSRLSMWDNLMTSGHMITPSPICTNKPPIYDKLFHPLKSKSFSSMATMSRCQSPAATDMESPWRTRSSKKDNMCRSFVQDKESDLSPKSFFNCSRAMSHLTSSPQICMEYVWTDTYSVQDTVTGTAASNVFLSEDFVGQWYLCYILPSRFQLSVVKVDFSGGNMSCGLLTSISAKEAINVPHLRMMALLEHSGNVTLYSGLTMVGKLHLGGTLLKHTPSPCVRRYIASPFPKRSSLLPLSKPVEPMFDEHLFSPVLPLSLAEARKMSTTNQNSLPIRYGVQERKRASLVGLIDPIENRITLKYSDGTFYRITLPLLTHSVLIERCLVALRQCLPRDAVLVLACRWYSMRNVIGTEDVNAKQEWEMFTSLLLELFGYEDDDLFEKPETPAVKRSKTIPLSSDDDWNCLLEKQHNIVRNPLFEVLQIPLLPSNSKPSIKPEPAKIKVLINPKGILFPYIRFVHFTLHLLYEDFKLNTLYTECLLPLAKLLSNISNDLGLREYSLHYWKDFPKDVFVGGPKIEVSLMKCVNQGQGLSDVPLSVMEQIYKLLKGSCPSAYPYFANVNGRSRDIIQLCGILSEINRDDPTEVALDSFIKDISQEPIQNVHQKSVYINTSSIEQVILIMVEMKIDPRYLETLPPGIYYLLHNALWKRRENPPSDWPVDAYSLLCRDDLVAQAQKNDMEKTNICFQLQETMPNTKQEIADLDGMEDIDCSLTKIRFSDDIRVTEARKMLASSKPVLITLTQRPDVSDHDFIEEQEKHLYGICIRTMALPVGRGMMTLRTAIPIITEPLSAPVLCLTGKALPRGNAVELNHIDTPPNMNLWPIFHNGVANGLRITPDAQNIDSTWIIFNKPKGGADAQMEHAGFLMALGLNGHLKNLVVMSTFEYLSNSKTHEMTSVGILLGLAADFRGTCHHFLTTLLAIHIEALLPPTSMELDICYNLQVAGLLGLGLLYQRSAHRHMTEVLLSEIGRPPGPEMENSIDRESHSLAAGLALGLVMLKHGDQPTGMSDLNVPDTLHYYMVGGNKRPLTGSQKDKYKTPSFQIREGSSVNLDVTAPGATLAIGLMYLDSGNKAVADWMAPPKTQYLLDFVRPDFLMLRILARSLILWKEIEPTKEWVIGEVPASLRPYCMVTPTNDADIDYEAMNQAYCNIVAGACFALGLRYAGSADQDAFETLLYFCHMFTSLTGKSIAELAGKATIETCLNVLLISASMVMAGTGNLEIMRLIRHLRRRVGIANSAIVTYGSHLAIHMALGLLFLGGGRYTLSNSPANVAALICAFYPKFPTHSNDNRYHLQAFRHLYVLAVEPRLIIPKDVFYDDICYAKLRVVTLIGQEISIKGPGLIPDINNLTKVMVDDDRYWPVVFERGRNWDLLTKILSTTGYIEVKQRAGCLSYISDKLGYHSDLARTLTHSKIVPWDPSSNAIVSFTSDEAIRKFCETVLNIDRTKASQFEQRIVQILTRTVYDAVVKDKMMVVVVIVALLKTIMNLQYQSDSAGLWQLKIIIQQILVEPSSSSLISKETILALKQEVTSLLDRHEEGLKPAIQQYLCGKDFDSNEMLSSYVTFFDIPTSEYLSDIKKMGVLERAAFLRSHFFDTDVLSKLVWICE